MQTDWNKSAGAWIRSIKSESDYARFAVLDDPMIETVRQSGAKTALDVGCGEGRFCRMMAEHVPEVTGLDPTALCWKRRVRSGMHGMLNGSLSNCPLPIKVLISL